MKDKIIIFLFGVCSVGTILGICLKCTIKENIKLERKSDELSKAYYEVVESSKELDSLLNALSHSKILHVEKRDGTYVTLTENVIKLNVLSELNSTEEDRREALQWLDSL